MIGGWTVAKCDMLASMTGYTQIDAKLADRTARRIEDDIAKCGWPVGKMLGSEAALIEKYQIGRDTFREAMRMLVMRGVVHIRRGRAGGLEVNALSKARVLDAFDRCMRQMGATRAQADDAQRILGLVNSHMRSGEPGEKGYPRRRAMLEENDQSFGLSAALHMPPPDGPRAGIGSENVTLDLLASCLAGFRAERSDLSLDPPTPQAGGDDATRATELVAALTLEVSAL